MNNLISPCIFIKKSETGFAIIAVYVDDLNLVGTPKELIRTTNYLKKEFEMKDISKLFYMDKTHPLSSPMVVWSLDVKKDLFWSCEKGEKLLGPEVPYLSAIDTLTLSLSVILSTFSLLFPYSLFSIIYYYQNNI